MKPRRTKTTTACFVLPGGNEDNDLWVEPATSEGGHVVLCSYWIPDKQDLAKLATGAAVELRIFGGVHPPVSVVVSEIEEFKA